MSTGQPQRKGSFVSPSTLLADQVEQEAERIAAEDQENNDGAENTGEDGDALEKIQIGKLELTADEVVAAYPAIWQQVQQKVYLLRGYVTATITIADKLELRVRTLTKGMRRFLMRVVDKTEESRTAVESGMLTREADLQTLCMLDGVGKEDFEDLTSFVATLNEKIDRAPDATVVRNAYHAFLDHAAVKARQVALDGLSEAAGNILMVATFSLQRILEVCMLKDVENPFEIR